MTTDIKILHIGTIDFPIPWDDWYRFVEQVQDVKVTYESLDHLPANIKDLLRYNIIRVDRQYAAEAFHFFEASNPLISQRRYIDLIYRKNGALWPFITMKDMIHSIIVDYQPFINDKGAALILGTTPEAIVCGHALIERGFKHITFVVKDLEAQKSLQNQLSHSLFDVKIEFINRESMILLSGIYSILVCFENIYEQVELQTALLYFNYLMRGGLIINAGYSIEKTPLLEEANAIKAKVVDIAEVQFYQEVMALQKAITVDEFTFKNLHQIVQK